MIYALNKAQVLMQSFMGDAARPFGYKAPHAPIGTPAKPHRARKHWDAMKPSRFNSRPAIFGGRP